MLAMTTLDLNGQRVLMREDLNVPLQQGQISCDARIKAALPSIRAALAQNARLILMSHLGRPIEGPPSMDASLAPVAARLAQLLGQPVPLIQMGSNFTAPLPGQLVLLENVRFAVGEAANDPALAQRLAQYCDIFVMDAFASAHRAHASTVGVIDYAPVACAGPLLLEELTALDNAFTQPKRPLLVVVGGAKVSSKMRLLSQLLAKADTLIIGGGMANTFLKAQGHFVGDSLVELDWVPFAKALLARAKAEQKQILLPQDVIVASELSSLQTTTKSIDAILAKDKIFDIGPQTIAQFAQAIAAAHTVIWNGPVGVFEVAAFSQGTQALAKAMANTQAYTVAGGGDTMAAIAQYAVAPFISYISTGGGAFLAYMQGMALPAIAALQRRAAQ
jgi:phosphoglycerate kinase